MNRNYFKCHGLGLSTALLMLWTLTGAPAVQAEDPNGGWAGDWLTNYQSARAMGLGGSFVSLADDPLGMVPPHGFQVIIK